VRRTGPSPVLVLGAAVAGVLALTPLVYIAIRALEPGLGTFLEILGRPRTVELLVRSVALAAAVTAACLVIGVACAWLVVRTDLPGRPVWTVLFCLPLAVPSYVAGFTWISEWPQLAGFPGAFVVLTAVSFPFVLLPVAAAFRGVDPALEEVARSLGHGPLRVFVSVTLRRVRPAAAGGGGRRAHRGVGPGAAPERQVSPALQVSGVRAGYGATEVLHGVDLEVLAGTFAAVLGESGCGKTTLLRAIAGFHPLDAGSIRLAGREVAGPGVDLAPERRRIGLVPQEGALFGHLSVAGNVGFGLPRAQRRGARVAEMLELVGLAGYGLRMPAELSGGQQQRVALARALAPAPTLVLLDEPFAALDAGLRAEVREQVRAALAAAGTTAVLVTHDQQEALGMADVVAVLRDGRVVQAATPRQLYGEPADIGVGTFVGEAVVLAATVIGGHADTALGRVPVPAGVLDGEGRVLLRPEQLRLSPPQGAPVRARVVEVVFHGHDTTVLLDVDGIAVRCRTAEPTAPDVGARVDVGVSGTARFYPG